MKLTLTLTIDAAGLLLCRYAVRTGQVPRHNLTWRKLRALLADEIHLYAVSSLDGWADDATVAEQDEARAWAHQQVQANYSHLASPAGAR